MKLIESGSSIGTYCDCPRKYEFGYLKLLSSQFYNTPLAYGSFVHAFVEEHFSGRTVAGPIREEYKRVYPEDWHAIVCDYSLAESVVREWIKYWTAHQGDLGNGAFRMKHTEKEWRYEVDTGDDHLGKSDGVLKHRTYDGFYLYELKTSGEPNRDGYKHRLELDKQISSNLIAMHRDALPPKGVLYDIIWKPATKRSKAAKHKNCLEPLPQFYERILSAYKEEPQRYFERLMVFRSEKDIADYGRDLHGQYSALRGSHERGYFHRNTNSCEKYGKLCPFFNLCLDPGAAEVEQSYRKRDRKLPELSKGIQS